MIFFDHFWFSNNPARFSWMMIYSNSHRGAQRRESRAHSARVEAAGKKLLLFFKLNTLICLFFSLFLKEKCTHQTMISLKQTWKYRNIYIWLRFSSQYYFKVLQYSSWQKNSTNALEDFIIWKITLDMQEFFSELQARLWNHVVCVSVCP